MSNQQPKRSQQRRGKGKNRQRGGGKGGGAKRIDPTRGFWSNGVAEQSVRAITGQVRPADDPTALVRSLGPAPLGRHAQAAALTFDVVYRKAAQLAIAAAVSNGVLLDEDGDGAGAAPVDAP
ncbi:MAG: hypothetical protein R2726_07800 [Acidimicrobiales bacterium]